MSEPSFFACAMMAFTFSSNFSSPLFRPIEHGEFLIRNLVSGFFGGFFAMMAAAMTLPVATSCTWFDRKELMVPLLSS
ncbi:hypothetical protein D3C81_2166130 [compost metagenome]